ncbi:MAG: phosphate ABC transporter substrate-binding protein [Clostridiales bacterium]
MKKEMLFKILVLVVAIMVIFTFTLTGCGYEEDDNADTTDLEDKSNEGGGLSGDIVVMGSTSVQPLAEELAEGFKEKEKDINVDIQGVGSSAGITAANDETANIGTSSRDLKDEEKEWGLTEHKIAIDGIAVVLHPDNKVEDLSQEDITKIFKGEITNWKDVGGDDKEITVVSREEGSGTRGAFEEIMDLVEKDGDKERSLVKEEAQIAGSNGEVKTNVSGKEDSIGYLSLGIVDEKIKAVKVDGVEATVEEVKAGNYKIQRPFLMLTKGDGDELVKAFLDYILGDGQEIVGKDYITVN